MCFVVIEYHTKFPAYERVVLRERKSLLFYLQYLSLDKMIK